MEPGIGECYDFNSKRRGLCLLINIAEFSESYGINLTRKGSENDVSKLKRTFTALSFDVQIWPNEDTPQSSKKATASEMLKYLRKGMM